MSGEIQFDLDEDGEIVGEAVEYLDNGKPAYKFSGSKPSMNQLLKGCDEI